MNIAEILRHCPKGTKLYSLIHGEVFLENTESLKHAELVENLVSQLKGKDVHAVVEIILTVGILLDAKELVGMMECFNEILLEKVRRELLKSAKKGKIIIPDAMSFALMLKEFMGKD